MANRRPARPKQSRLTYGNISSNPSSEDFDRRMGEAQSSTKNKTVRTNTLNHVTLRKIGFENNLSHGQTEDFLEFMDEKFPTQKNWYTTEHYADEWAERFRNKTEWANGDYESRQVLRKINPAKYGNPARRRKAELSNSNAGHNDRTNK